MGLLLCPSLCFRLRGCSFAWGSAGGLWKLWAAPPCLWVLEHRAGQLPARRCPGQAGRRCCWERHPGADVTVGSTGEARGASSRHLPLLPGSKPVQPHGQGFVALCFPLVGLRPMPQWYQPPVSSHLLPAGISAHRVFPCRAALSHVQRPSATLPGRPLSTADRGEARPTPCHRYRGVPAAPGCRGGLC